jgi:hypothetical protein
MFTTDKILQIECLCLPSNIKQKVRKIKKDTPVKNIYIWFDIHVDQWCTQNGYEGSSGELHNSRCFMCKYYFKANFHTLLQNNGIVGIAVPVSENIFIVYSVYMRCIITLTTSFQEGNNLWNTV